MVKKTNRLKEIAALYKIELSRLGIQETQIFAFGSYVLNTQHEGSDIDLIVVSADFARFNTRERFELLGVAAARLLEPIQAYGLTPLEIEQRELTPFLNDILTSKAVPVS